MFFDQAGGAAPEHLVLILEGESLFNDATRYLQLNCLCDTSDVCVLMMCLVNRIFQAECVTRSITLFEIMLDLVKDLGASPATQKETLMQLVKIAWEITWLALGDKQAPKPGFLVIVECYCSYSCCGTAGGLMFGLLFGWVTRQVLKFIKRGGHKAPEQLALSLAMAYLVFYTSQVGKRPHIVLYRHNGPRWSRQAGSNAAT